MKGWRYISPSTTINPENNARGNGRRTLNSGKRKANWLAIPRLKGKHRGSGLRSLYPTEKYYPGPACQISHQAMEGSSNPPLDQIGVLSIMPGKQGNTCKGKRSRPTLKTASQEKDDLLQRVWDSLLPPRELGAQMTPKMGPQQGAWPRSLFIPTDLRHPSLTKRPGEQQ